MPIFAALSYRAGLNVTTVLFMRFLVAAVLLLPVAWWELRRRRGTRIPRGKVAGALVMGGVLYTAQATCYFTAVREVGPALTAVLLYIYPALVALAECVIHRLRPRALLLVALLLSFSGVALSAGPMDGALKPWGVAIGLLAGVVYVSYILVGDRVVSGMPTLTMSLLVFLGATAGLGVMGAARGQLRWDFQPVGWLWIACLSIAASIIGIICFFLGMERIGATRASIGSTLEPVTSMAVAALALGSALSPVQYLGAALVVTGAVLGVLTAPRPQDADEVKGP